MLAVMQLYDIVFCVLHALVHLDLVPDVHHVAVCCVAAHHAAVHHVSACCVDVYCVPVFCVPCVMHCVVLLCC